ncbi:peptidase inhibitor family I36 protein [Streptomyces sp. NPDC017448]|uniref:peptidase inhibitor family I36 protein n=1 Tax=Streptomyces sp. NPDC017448 TaxID=3364996 RepID=UPI00378BD66C
MRAVRRTLLGLTLAAGLPAATATGAHAGGTNPTYTTWNPGNCPAGNLCVYKGVNYATEGVGIAMFQYDNRIWSETRNSCIAHEDSSWFTNGTGTSYSSVVVYPDNNYGGNSFCPDKGRGNTWDSVANDQGEANQWIDGPCRPARGHRTRAAPDAVHVQVREHSTRR